MRIIAEFEVEDREHEEELRTMLWENCEDLVSVKRVYKPRIKLTEKIDANKLFSEQQPNRNRK